MPSQELRPELQQIIRVNDEALKTFRDGTATAHDRDAAITAVIAGNEVVRHLLDRLDEQDAPPA